MSSSNGDDGLQCDADGEQGSLDMKVDLEEALPTPQMCHDETQGSTHCDHNDESDSATQVETNDCSSNNSEDQGEDGEADILEETTDPTDLIADAVAQKEEGNTHFKEADLTLASRCYRKGISLLKKLNHANTGDEQVKSLLISLQNNLSMVCFKQDKFQQSRDIATKALEIEPINVKALFRRAIASRKLGDLDSAKKDLYEAWKQSPNKDIQRELHAIKKEIDLRKRKEKEALSKAFSSKSSLLYNDKEEEEKKRIAEKQVQQAAREEEKKKRKAQWEEECVQRMSKGEEAISFEDWDAKQKKEEETARKKAKQEEEERNRERMAKKSAMNSTVVSQDDDDDELTETELKMFRGYKKTSDGKTTSYFTREQTDAEKELLGSIAPQRLDAVPKRLESSANSNSSPTEVTGASAWNQAGTWEERNTTDWCTESLRQHLQKSTATVENKIVRASVREVKSLSGEASVAFVSGKKRYLFDYHAQLKYIITNIETDEKVASGTLNLPDISSTAINDEIEIEGTWKKTPSEEQASVAIQCRNAFISVIRSQVSSFVRAFNAEF